VPEPLAGAAAVLLDMDGTLVLSEAVHRQTWRRFFENWHVQVSEDEYERTYLGRRALDVLAEVPGPWTGTDITAALRAMDEHASELADAVRVVPGAVELLRALHRRRRPVAVVTSAGRDWARHVLDRVLEAADTVSVLVTARTSAWANRRRTGTCWLAGCSASHRPAVPGWRIRRPGCGRWSGPGSGGSSGSPPRPPPLSYAPSAPTRRRRTCVGSTGPKPADPGDTRRGWST